MGNSPPFPRIAEGVPQSQDGECACMSPPFMTRADGNTQLAPPVTSSHEKVDQKVSPVQSDKDVGAALSDKVFYVLVGVTAVVGTIVLVVVLSAHDVGTQRAAEMIAALFLVLALMLSFWQIGAHLAHYTKPELQKYIIRILWMVPVYALTSWFALRYDSAAIYLSTCRQLYEAYVIYSFFHYLVALVELNGKPCAETIASNPPVSHAWPLCCLASWEMGEPFLRTCRFGVMTYVLMHALTSATAFVLTSFTDLYEEGKIRFSSAEGGYTALAFINNAIQMWAMYCLIQFYRCAQPQLNKHQPVAKMVCVKAVVFFAWWQSVIIAILVGSSVITATEHLSLDNIQTGSQQFLICIEMFLAAMAHRWAFAHTEFAEADAKADLYIDPEGFVQQSQVTQSWSRMFCILFDVSEFCENVSLLPQDVSCAASRPKLNPELEPLCARVCGCGESRGFERASQPGISEKADSNDVSPLPISIKENT